MDNKLKDKQYMLEELVELSSDFDIKHILKHHAYVNLPLNFDEAYLLGVYAMTPFSEKLFNAKLFDRIRHETRGKEDNILLFMKGISEENKIDAARRTIIGNQSLAAMCALHTKETYLARPSEKESERHIFEEGHSLPKNSAEQIAGISAAIFDYDIGCSQLGFLRPNVDFAIDNCGMGGDMYKTPNISTLASLIAAGEGIPMCKHGSPCNADAGRHGSSDFVSMILDKKSFMDLIGIDKKRVEESIEKYNFGYTEALDSRYKRVHLLTHQYSMLPHMNDIIGPMTNPLEKEIATRKIIGVNHLISPEIVGEAFDILNKKGVTKIKHGIFVRGYIDEDRTEGIDELSTLPGGSQICELRDGILRNYRVHAKDFGINESEYKQINPGDNKGGFSKEILYGRIKGDAKKIVLANAALIFRLKHKTDMRTSYQIAEEAFESKRCLENLQKLKEHYR